MQNAATVNDPAPVAIGILGANESNLSFAPSKAARTIGEDVSVVVVACRQWCRMLSKQPNLTIDGINSRLRKVRCDSGRPVCTNCTRRSDPCEYDAAPKRRGPDKEPGTRLRLYKKRPENVPPPKRVAKSRVNESSSSNSPEQHELQGPQRNSRRRKESNTSRKLHGGERVLVDPSVTPQALVLPPQIQQRRTPGHVDDELDVTLRLVGFESLERLLRITKDEAFVPETETAAPDVNGRSANWKSNLISTAQERISGMGVYSPVNGHISELVTEAYIPRGPSSSFHKQTWWDSLLSLYFDDPTQSALKVFQDLNFILNNTIYWHSFINLPRFMDNLYDPDTRIFVQPSVVLAALALATMMKSSEIGLGGEGRKFALWLRDAAQSSLDASISASWIEPSLAQAAFVYFWPSSKSLHIQFTLALVLPALSTCSTLLSRHSLTTIDALEPTVTTFLADEIPGVTSSPAGPNSSQSTAGDLQSPSFGGDDTTRFKCTCGKVAAMPAVGIDTSSNSWNPLQHSQHQFLDKSMPNISSNNELDLEGRTRVMTDWPEPTNVAEIQKEESRRLCWSSMMLITALREYTPLEFDRSVWDLHVTKYENFALFFPGEKVRKTDPKASIWALHGRAAILWNSCQKLRSKPDWDSRHTELAGKAWMEVNAIEDALETHACPKGHGVPYAGREYLLQLKLLISNQFTTSSPIPHTLGLYKDSAKEWLTHRAGIANHVRKIVYFLTRFGPTVAALALAKRPLSIWWAMYQIKAGTLLWKSDPSLTMALEQSVEFLAIVDFMSAMWPSALQRRHYGHIRMELLQCCVSAGIRVPAPIPIPGLPVNLHATMIPSISLTKQPSPADIPMAPLD